MFDRSNLWTPRLQFMVGMLAFLTSRSANKLFQKGKGGNK